MENQHRKIRGYRELSQVEIDLMNEIKELGPQIEKVLTKVELHLINQQQAAYRAGGSEDLDKRAEGQDEVDRLSEATPKRFAALAKTDLQTGLMYLTRAVAQPTFF